MSLKMMSQVWEHPNLKNSTDKLVLLALADWANDEGECWPSIPKVAAKCSITERAATEIIGLFEKFGYLTAQRGGGRGKSSHYILHPHKGQEITREKRKGEFKTLNTVQGLEDAKTLNQTAENGQINPEPGSPPYKRINRQVITEPSEREAHAPNCTQTFAHPAKPDTHAGLEAATQTGGLIDLENPQHPQFQTPQFFAVCVACQLDPQDITPRTRGRAAMTANILSRKYSPEQIEAIGANCPYEIAPTLDQLRDNADRWLNRRTPQSRWQAPAPTPAAPDAAATQTLFAERQARRAALANSQVTP